MIPVKQTTNRDSKYQKPSEESGAKISEGKMLLLLWRPAMSISRNHPRAFSQTTIQLYFSTTQISPKDTIAYTE
jgi:hypothetical protein